MYESEVRFYDFLNRHKLGVDSISPLLLLLLIFIQTDDKVVHSISAVQ